jgi:hypothetical protein
MAQALLTKSHLNISEIINKDVINGVDILKKTHKKYTIVKYNKKTTLPSAYFRVGYLRSLIIDNESKMPVCVGPIKSIPLNEIEEYSSIYQRDEDSIHYEEFVDGVMINVFWDKVNEVWEYATRSNIGANIRFYLQNEGNKTFRTMFEEALVADSINLDVLPKKWCYTFVLQHPQNRIVAPVERPHVVLVEAHKITDSIISIFPHGNTEEDKELREITLKYNMSIPKYYDYKTMKEAKENHATRNTDFSCVGIMIKNYNKGWRSKMRNPVYEDVKQLRGNCPKQQFLYMTLRHGGNVGKYLSYYKEQSSEFENYRRQIHRFTDNVYRNYVECFINKKAHINTYPHQYKVCMTSLHSIYLNELREKGKHVHKGVVIQYFNELPPQRQLYLLNYNYRK